MYHHSCLMIRNKAAHPRSAAHFLQCAGNFFIWLLLLLPERPVLLLLWVPPIHTQMDVQVSVPLHSFPITYKYMITRKSGDLEREVSSVLLVAALVPCLEYHYLPRESPGMRIDLGPERNAKGCSNAFRLGKIA